MDRDDVIVEVLRALEKVLSSKTSPELIDAIIQDLREELYPGAAHQVGNAHE